MDSVKEAMSLLINSGSKALEEIDKEIRIRQRELDELIGMRRMLTGLHSRVKRQKKTTDLLAQMIKAISDNGPQRPSKLADLVKVSPSTITRYLKSSSDIRKNLDGFVELGATRE